MLNEKTKSVLRIALPVLFIFYASCVSLFVHTHVVNGVTIVHSHPYSKDNSGKPIHEHTGAEIQLIHHLSSFYVPAQIVSSVTIDACMECQEVIRLVVFCSLSKGITEGISRLRPPPIFKL